MDAVIVGLIVLAVVTIAKLIAMANRHEHDDAHKRHRGVQHSHR
ncbi:MAG: hypothetical protein ACRESW_05500 [Nevskiales bacterium]